MSYTPLQDAIRAQPGNQSFPTADYRGATTAARFADPQLEFAALVNGCGIYDLGFRARISLTGGDRVRWLNGMVTNNIRDLAAGHGVYAFLLSPQGRILGDMFVHNHGEALIVETDRSQIEKIAATFDHYIIMDDVEVTDVSDQQTALGLTGPRSRAILNLAGIEVPNLKPLQMITPRCNCDCGCLQCTVIRGEHESQESYEIWLAPNDAYKTWQALLAAGATPVGSEALEMQRIVTGIPLYGVDIRERDLPQETEQMRALNFNKGCYVGQEIVERIRSRGNVHRKFTGFIAEDTSAIAAGAKIVSDEKEVGEVTSVARLRTDSGEREIALGYIRREVGMPGREVTIGAAKATVTQLPLESIALGQAEDSVLHQA
ncbi:MAG TPA: glycine cleavage T C-terminal barrel domain-containing protein [Candidatus Acidoferrum sp.]|jgi:folate-binding protein YgfZ|nr:glycine cleavage T C-terminal barrel domain-containing protein [Candidatus Acidoferrum sp.]